MPFSVCFVFSGRVGARKQGPGGYTTDSTSDIVVLSSDINS